MHQIGSFWWQPCELIAGKIRLRKPVRCTRSCLVYAPRHSSNGPCADRAVPVPIRDLAEVTVLIFPGRCPMILMPTRSRHLSRLWFMNCIALTAIKPVGPVKGTIDLASFGKSLRFGSTPSIRYTCVFCPKP